MPEWEGIDRDAVSPIVSDAIQLREEGLNWTQIGHELGVHRTTISRWARGVSAPPPENRYISRDEARHFSQTARRSVDRRDAERNLRDFINPDARYAPRRIVRRSFIKKGKRYTYTQRLGRGQTDEQEERMRRLGKVYEQQYRERYPRGEGQVGQNG